MEFFSWWIGSLYSALPQWLKMALFGHAINRKAVFSANAKQIVEKDKIIHIPISLLNRKTTNQIFPYKSNKTINLCVPDHLLLCRPLAFPQMKKHDLIKAVVIENSRNTPFKTGEMLWVLDTTPNKITQYLSKKSDLEYLSQTLKKKGLSVHGFQAPNGMLFPSIYHSNKNLNAPSFWNLINVALTCLILSIIGINYWQDISSITIRRSQAELAADSAKAQALELRKEINQSKEEQTQKSNLIHKLSTQTYGTDILREVTVALPDSVWLNSLQYHKPEIIIAGTVKGSAAKLVLELSKSDKFENPRINGAISRGQKPDTEKFTIALTYKNENYDD